MTLALVFFTGESARADALRLRADALAETQSPVGLVTLQGDGDLEDWLSAEALVWLGAGSETEADALVILVRARDPKGRAELELGRFIATAGAIRPTHLDGIEAGVKLPGQVRLDAFAGVPVAPHFGQNAFDWAAGGRVSRRIGEIASVGIAYLHRREKGSLADEEIGLDANAVPFPWLDLSGRVALDLIQFGVTEARVAAGTRRGAWSGDIYFAELSPSRLLPATSLFSVLGDVPATSVGTDGKWRAAPRLDVGAGAALRFLGQEPAWQLSGRTLLRLDDRGDGYLSLELRKDAAPDGGFWGARSTALVPLAYRLHAAAELEIAFPQNTAGRGKVWPWGLLALGWKPTSCWEAALAVEASASPEFRQRVDALARVSRSWGGP
jgi:hypothetical protein